MRGGGRVAIVIDGHDHELGAEDLLISMKPIEGYQVEREGSHAVALELEIDDELRVEGWAREIVHAVQAARRDAGLEISDRIVLTLDGAPSSLAAAPRPMRRTSRARRSRSRSATSRSLAEGAVDARSTACALRIGVARVSASS